MFHSGWQRLAAVTAESYKPTAGDLAKNHVGKSLGRLLKGSLSQLFPRKSENVTNGREKQQLTHKGRKKSVGEGVLMEIRQLSSNEKHSPSALSDTG